MSFKEAHWLRRESIDRYKSLNIALLKKKEMLFKETPKNLAKWEIPSSQMQEALRSCHNAELSFKMMLPTETRRVNYMADESAYFTN
jgi:hypothetical protein